MLLKKINYQLRLLWIKTLLKFGIYHQLVAPKQAITRILVFHGIDTIGQTHYNSRFISAQYFEKLLIELKKYYTFISLDDLYNQHFDASKNNLVVTFDDGLQNNVDFALPILKKLNIPATFFVTSCSLHHEVLWPDFLDLVTYYTNKSKVTFDGKEYFKNRKNEFEHQGKTLKNRCKQLPFTTVQQLFTLFEEEWLMIKNKKLDVYWQLMSLDEVKSKLSNPLFSVGAHSVHHPNLVALQIDDAEYELSQSKLDLESALGIHIHQFAFPFGTYSHELITLAKKIGYTQLLPLKYNQATDASDPILKNRFMINPHIGWKEQIYFIKKGTY